MKLLKLLLNKYFLATVFFIVWLCFFDQYDYFMQSELRKDLRETKENIAYLNAEISKMEIDYNALKNDSNAFEKYARERYNMKRDNEDIYLIKR